MDQSATGNKPEIVNIEPSATGVGTGAFFARAAYFAVVPLPLPELYQYTAVAEVIDQSNQGPAVWRRCRW